MIGRFFVWLLTGCVRAYQIALSPVMGGACRFHPTCSAYMIEALRVHGAVKGSLLGLWRILRCHPFGAHGYDPVPPVGLWYNTQIRKVNRDEQEKRIMDGRRAGAGGDDAFGE